MHLTLLKQLIHRLAEGRRVELHPRLSRTWFSRPVAGPSPLHYLPYIVLAPKVGIEPTTNRLTVCCTTAVLLWNCLVAGPGIAPGTRAYETLEILLLQPAIVWCRASTYSHLVLKSACPRLDLVPCNRIELLHPDYKTGPLPLRITGQ